MRRPYSRLAAACAFGVAMTAFTGSALAGNGHGNDTAPGQVKKDQAAAAPAPAPSTAQPDQQAAQSQPPGQAKKQQSQAASASAQSSSSTQTGVKPSSTTAKWTHCTTGGTPSATTCKSSDNGHTPQPNADASKKYGNGKTAAQIAVSRGGIGVQLTGPGNSQPHKVTVCGKPNNKSGGVDVHAVKTGGYSNLNCTQTQIAAIAPVAPCGFTVVATTSVEGNSHGHGKGLSHNKHEQSTTSYSLQPDSSQSCNSAAATQTCGTPATCSNTPVSQATVAPVTSAAAPVVQSSPAAPVTRSTGGVLGAQIKLTPPRPAGHGVLGAVTNLSGATLPFTGFPIWVAIVIALALILAGLALRRRGSVNQL